MCDMNRARLIAWMDDETDIAEAAVVREHVHRCDECAREVRAIRSLTTDIAEYSRLLAAQRRPRWRWVPAAAAAAVLLAAAVQLTDTPRPQAPNLVSSPALSDPRVVPVAVPIQDLLPIGAAPPGAVIVGELVLDPGGAPPVFRTERSQPIGD